MADAHDRPAVQMLKQLFAPAALEKHAALATYLEEGGSVFPLIEKGVYGLVRDYQLDPVHARQLLRRANSMATYLRRQFIEQTLAGKRDIAEEDDVVAQPSSGLLSIVPGPSYEVLFNPRFGQLSPPQALESITSPVAYLMELLRWINQRLDPEGVDEAKYLFHERRKDIKQLSIDYNAVHRPVSAVDIIVPVLETFIKANDPALELDDALYEARYPNGLPYYQHWVSIDGVTRHHGVSVGHLVQRTDLQFPYFLQQKGWDADLGRALAHASRLGPYQRGLLTEAPVEHGDRVAFYEENFGTTPVEYQNLSQVPFFGERTKLDSERIEALFSIRDFAPVRSPNVTFAEESPPGSPESWRSGSVYLNGNEIPAISINFARQVHRLNVDPTKVEGLARFDRINRKVRLDSWMQLPSDQTDALLVAAIQAEARGKKTEPQWQITDNVTHALGLFQALREHHQCTAEDFAAFINTLSVYGRSDSASHFDRVFNSQGTYREPLKLDNGTFPVLPATGVSDLTVNQLCSGLGIDLQTYQYLAVAIARAQGSGNSLKRSLAVVSGFYRLVYLPRLLGITPVEGVLMLTLLGGDDWVNGLAGEPLIDESGSQADVLSLIDALETCVEWCRESDLPVLWVLQHVAPPVAPNVLSEQDQQLIEKINNMGSSALFSDARLQMAGVPPLPSASWLDLLSGQSGEDAPLVDSLGLVLDFDGSEEAYQASAMIRLEKVVKEGLGDLNAELLATIVEKMLGVLLLVRQAQASLAKESLAVYVGISAEQVLAVLRWANSDVCPFLRQVLEADEPLENGTVIGPVQPHDPLLTLLAELRRRSEVVAKLDLSAALLTDYLDYGHKDWFELQDKHAFSISTLYYLSVLGRAFGLSEQPQQKLLDYLRQVNHLPTDLGGNAKTLVQEAAAIRLADFFGWSVQEVRECIERMKPEVDPPDQMLLKNLQQLDLLTRIRALSAHTNMDALTLFLIGKLSEDVGIPDKAAYAAAAERALLSVTETAIPAAQLDGDLKKLVDIECTLDVHTVVAGKPGEKAVFTVTVKDAAGKALSGIPVYWQASLGTISGRDTDTDGVLKAEYTPGKIQGTETPMFWLPLMDPQFAPAISVSYEAKSLRFLADWRSPLPTGPVSLGQEVEVYATLIDAYSNLGPNSLMRWVYKAIGPNVTVILKIRPEQSFTNQDGLARAFVSSTEAGTFILSALSDASGISTAFDPIIFQADEPDA